MTPKTKVDSADSSEKTPAKRPVTSTRKRTKTPEHVYLESLEAQRSLTNASDINRLKELRGK